MNYRSFFSRTCFSVLLLLILVLPTAVLAAPPVAQGTAVPGEAPVNVSGTTHTIRFPANALNFEKDSTILTQSGTGILWKHSYAGSAELTVPRPPDWDGVSDVTMSLYFYPTTTASAMVQFFIRPQGCNPGDTLSNVPTGLSGDTVPVSTANQVREQVIPIPADRFGTKELWVITIQRKGSGETYTGDVVLMSAGLSYTRKEPMPSSAAFILPANALNFNKSSDTLVQSERGILLRAGDDGGAFLTVPRPPDWDGVSDVTLSLYFYGMGGLGEKVQFFARPGAFDPGETIAQAADLPSDAVYGNFLNHLLKQVITIPAGSFGAKALWTVALLRGGPEETFKGDVFLMSVGLGYTRQPPANFGASYNLPANALNFDKDSTTLAQFANGILWQAGSAEAATLIVARPPDWDGVSDVTLSLYFVPTSSASGNVLFFAGPRAYDPGETLAGAAGITGDAVSVSTPYQVRKQVITIPAARFGAKELWVIAIHRGGAGETYTGDVVLMSVGLGYAQPFTRVFLPAISK